MKFFISIILLSLFAFAFPKKNFGHKTHKQKIYGNNDELNARQLAKQEYYRNKHFDDMSREHIKQLAKHSPIAVSEHDIRLQADVNDDTRRTHHNTEPHLNLQHIGTHHNIERNTEHKRIDDQMDRRDNKHNSHKKHQINGKHVEHKRNKYGNGEKSGEMDSIYGKQHLNADQNVKHEKHQRKEKHHKKNKKDVSKKYKKSYSKYY